MQTTETRSWIDQLEVTGPIKVIMDLIDDLSSNYDRRVAAMHADYQKDVEEILNCYKAEKQNFHNLLEQQKNTIEELQGELKALQQSYKTLNVEYKMTQECLITNKEELAALTKALKSEEEFLALAKERIAIAQQQLELESNNLVKPQLAQELTPEVLLEIDAKDILVVAESSAQRKSRFNRAREFFKQVIIDRLTRPIILRSSEAEYTSNEIEDQDSFSY